MIAVGNGVADIGDEQAYLRGGCWRFFIRR
ncbi:MAG: hypothetical protein JWR26_1507 [Pedosphaera sp.]|nr:hypothetical protein [Pedosphaera sp.]